MLAPCRQSRPPLLGPLAVAALLIAPAPGRAALIIAVANQTAAAGSTGSFDVVLRDTDPLGSSAYRVASDTVQLALTAPAGVQFTGTTIATLAANPYLYARSGTTLGGGSPLAVGPFPGASLLAADSEFGPLGFRSVAPQAVFGLAHVTFAVAPSATSGVRAFAFDLGGTSLADDAGNALGFATSAGTFTVTPAAVVPEPGSALLLGLAAAGAGGAARRRGAGRRSPRGRG